ncbi:MAG: hypothetical protein GX638_05720 [Crenarchaeota archaeon]|nr:hypothetical protein [Thermoproteota archaeon]
MNAATIMMTIIKMIPHISILVLSLLWTYLTLGTKVRKTRRAFEKQLTTAGMSEENSKRLSAGYQELKDNLTITVKQAITNSFTAIGT